jgi:hypothetical protein
LEIQKTHVAVIKKSEFVEIILSVFHQIFDRIFLF